MIRISIVLFIVVLTLRSYATGILYEMSNVHVDTVSFTNCSLEEAVSTVTSLWHNATGKARAIDVSPEISVKAQGGPVSVTARNISLFQILDAICMQVDARVRAGENSIRIEPTAPPVCWESATIKLSDEDKDCFNTNQGAPSLPKINMMLWEAGVDTNRVDIGFPLDDGELVCTGAAEEVRLAEAVFILRKKGYRIVRIPEASTNSPSD